MCRSGHGGGKNGIFISRVCRGVERRDRMQGMTKRLAAYAGRILERLKEKPKTVLCRECEYLACEEATGLYWCRSTEGLDVLDLKPEDGCSRGRRRACMR